jgi:hypothetical protein
MRLSSFAALVVAAVVLSNKPVSAQTRLTFENLPTTGTPPSANFSIARPFSEIYGFSVDPIGQRVHWVLGEDWYRLDLRSRTWTRHAIRNGFDLDRPRWGVVPGTSELLVWDSGIGRVFRVDSDGTATRIDLSFDQKTQFNHLDHIDPDGSIFAIGGTGLHHPKNYAVSYSNASRGWHRLAGLDLISNDPYLHEGLVLNDPTSDHLLLFAHYALRKGHSDQGVLGMDRITGKISVIHPHLTSLGYETAAMFRFQHSATVHTGEHRFGFVRSGREKQIARNFHLTAISFDTYRVADVVGSITNDLDPRVHHLVLHYSEDDSSLYSVQWSHHSADVISVAVVQRAKVDVDAIRSALEKGVAPRKETTPERPWHTGSFYLGGAIMLLIGGVLCVLYRRQRPVLVQSQATDAVNLEITLSPLCLNGRSWADRFGADFPLEAKLLELLAESTLAGEPVVSSDTIDRLLIPKHPSPDYIRKTRNQTRKRLEETLQTLVPATSQPYILTDRDVLDKRKTKMRLNPDLVRINPPG